MRPALAPFVLALLLVTALASGGCALLVSIGLGGERGRSDLVVRTSDEGIVFLERKPKHPALTILLLHGFGGSKDHWTRFANFLPDDAWIIAPDLPGFGASPKIEGDSYDLESQRARVAQFLDENGVDKFHLVGNSMGGQLATLLALAQPDRVQSLVLFNPAGLRGPVPSAMDQLTKGGAEPLLIQNAADFDRLLALSFVIPPRIPGFLKDHFAEEAARSYPFSKKIKQDLAARPAPIADRIAMLRPPTLVVWGDSDGVLDPSAVPLWRARVPGHLVVVMKETGHGPMIERPQEAAALVLTWWRRGLKLPGAGPMATAWTASTSSPPTLEPATER